MKIYVIEKTSLIGFDTDETSTHAVGAFTSEESAQKYIDVQPEASWYTYDINPVDLWE